MKRFHAHVSADYIEQSVRFYSTTPPFSQPAPAKQRIRIPLQVMGQGDTSSCCAPGTSCSTS